MRGPITGHWINGIFIKIGSGRQTPEKRIICMSRFGDFLLRSRLVLSVINWSKTATLPGLKGFPIYDVMKVFFKNVKDAELNDRAGSISFFFLLALPPTCIFLFTLLPYIPLDNLENTIYLFVRDITPNQTTYHILHGIIYDFLHTQRTGLLSFAFVLAVFYSSTAVTGILRSFNRDHPGFVKRNVIRLRWMAIKINCLLILLLMVSVILMVAQSSLFTHLLAGLHVTNETTRVCINIVRWLIILLLFFMIISMIYTYGPAKEQRWKFITAGSTLATVLIILTTLGFSYYVNNFSNYNQIYGSIGSIIILMIWLFINSLVLLIGFELNTSIEILQRQAEAGRADQDRNEDEMQGLA